MVTVPDRYVAVLAIATAYLGTVSSATTPVPGIFPLSSTLVFNPLGNLDLIGGDGPGLHDPCRQDSVT